MTDGMKIKKISHEVADRVIVTRRPRGKFYTIEKKCGKKIYVGIDNEDGHAWVEDFSSLQSCKNWLQGKGAIDIRHYAKQIGGDERCCPVILLTKYAALIAQHNNQNRGSDKGLPFEKN